MASSTLRVVSWVCAWIFNLQRAHFSNPIAQHQTGTAGFVKRSAQSVGACPRVGADASLIECVRSAASEPACYDDRIPILKNRPIGLLDGRIGGQHAILRESSTELDAPRPRGAFVHAARKLVDEWRSLYHQHRNQFSTSGLLGTPHVITIAVPSCPFVDAAPGDRDHVIAGFRRKAASAGDPVAQVQVLSDLLWAAFGVNRPSGDRTAPYWRHIMVMEIYLAMADGVWLYEPKAHTLLPHLKDDIRAQTGLQDFVATAPLNLVYVAHGERMTEVSAEERRLYASVDAGFIGQNVYLFCASEGLATVFRGVVDYPKLTRTLQLPDQQFVTFAQTVGYPHA